MNALRWAWEKLYGAGSVTGLAPSAAAAEVLAGDLGIETENTAKWLHEHRHGNWNLQAGQLVVIDEASLAGTLALDAITAHAAEVGAKVLLVGDWVQLAAVDAGGAFREAASVTAVMPRSCWTCVVFRNDWEKHASLQLRIGLSTSSPPTSNEDVSFPAPTTRSWKTPTKRGMQTKSAGKTLVLIAETLDTVSALNTRVRTEQDPRQRKVALDGVRLV